LNWNLVTPFYRHAVDQPCRLALSVGGTEFSYQELAARAGAMAAWLDRREEEPAARVGILAARSWEAYAGVLGACWHGAAYVPLNPRLPEARLAWLLEFTGLDALIVDTQGLERLSGSVARACPRHILAPALHAPGCKPGLANAICGSESLPLDRPLTLPADRQADDLAYIIFTSGTTGTPKGVMVTNGNVAAFLAALRERYELGPHDRVAQANELSFDNSIFDLFNAWSSGASLHIVPAAQSMAPLHFVRSHEPTVWFSVPSIAICMQRMKMLLPGTLPSLRYSAFAGEALPVATAEAWRAAAPNSILDCLYGPTETTVVCTGDRFSDEVHTTENRGIVSIGKPFPGMEARILDESLHVVRQGTPGELAFSGSQVARGYFRNADQTAARFRLLDGDIWYLTGDLAYQDQTGLYHHLGRTDNQVKVNGYRVELEEVEAHLRTVCRTDSVAVVAWPMAHGTAAGLVAFVSGMEAGIAEIREGMKARVPAYMVPTRVYSVPALPATANGKCDRKTLIALLEQGAL
jgi:amino acid adenylation domain-containing protein